MLAATLPALDERLVGVAGTADNLDRAVSGLGNELTEFRAALEVMLAELSRLVSGMDDRFERVEVTVGQLGDTLLNLIGSIPGVRRAVRDPKPVGSVR